MMAIVREQWRQDVFSGHLFVFLGRRKDLVKILVWDRGGFVLYIKRLERGRFVLPPLGASDDVVHLDATSLAILLDGMDVSKVKRPAAWKPPASIKRPIPMAPEV